MLRTLVDRSIYFLFYYSYYPNREFSAQNMGQLGDNHKVYNTRQMTVTSE